MDKITELLTRGVDKIYPSKEELEKVLRSGKKLRLYQGFDPTTPELHIGHMVGLRKLRQWQDLGHEVIFLFGDFTGMIGDPSGKDKTRSMLTHEQVTENAKTYKQQAGRVLQFEGNNAITIKRNSDWWFKLSAADLLKLTSYMSYQQIIEREMFQRRIKKNMDIAIIEFLYPVIQGYDSVVMDVDLEIGGSDQLFNMMTGRDLLHKLKRKNKFVMTTPLLTDSAGNKIGKTEGNVIALTAPPNDFYGLIMSLGDDVIVKCFEFLTDLPMEEVREIEKKIASGENPMLFKKKLAYTLTSMLNDESAAKKAQENFERVVQQKEVPDDIKIITIINSINIIDLLAQNQLVESRSSAKRLLEQGGVEVDGKKISDQTFIVNPKDGMIIKVGKRGFYRLSLRAE